MTDHLFIVNPAAGKTDRTEFITKAVMEIPAEGNVSIYTTTAPGDGERYVYDRLRNAQNPTRVYACGGDGTLNEVAQGIYLSGNRNVALGMLPTGSGNDFIRSFRIPESRFRSVHDMMNGKTVPCDLILITDDADTVRVCINIASAGFDAAVCRGMETFKRVPLISGSAAYKLSLIRQLMGHLGHSFTVLADGETVGAGLKDEYLFVLGANGKYYGGGFKASPTSETDDGMMDLILIESLSRSDFARLINDYRKGTYFDKLSGRMAHRRVRSMQILSEQPLDMNLDGETVSMQNPMLTLLPSALQLILP